MFNWNPSPDSKVMSQYVWVYWAVTIPLTLVVILIWIIWMQRKYLSDKLKAASFVALKRTNAKVVPLEEGINLSPVRGRSQNRNSSPQVPITRDLEITPWADRFVPRSGRDSPDRMLGM
jgi:hypothetical protein